MKKILFTIILGILLSACSGGPSDSEIEDAFRENRGIGSDASIDIISVDNMKKTNDGAYASTVVLEINSKYRGEKYKDMHTLQLTMREANGEWIIVDYNTLRHETVK